MAFDETQIVGAIIGAIAVAAGAIVTYFLTRKRETELAMAEEIGNTMIY
jgi:hypothetical protein